MSLSSCAFLETADRIGNRLCRDAVWSEGRCNWLGWSLVPDGATLVPGYRAQGAGLDGVAGIALFLAWLHRFTHDPLQARTLHGALRQLDRVLTHASSSHPTHPLSRRQSTGGSDPDSDALAATGFHRGAAGIAAACLQLGDLLRDEAWLAHGLRTLETLARNAGAGDGARPILLDVADGIAGAIPVLLRTDARFDLPHLAIAAKRQADLLLDAVQRSELDGAWAWPPADAWDARPFLGYAHGAGGLACALLELHRAIGGERYRAAALAALRDERRQLATLDGPGWCDGAPAVACTLLRASELLAAAPPSTPQDRPFVTAGATDDASVAPDDAAEQAAALEAEAIGAEARALLDVLAGRLIDAPPWGYTFCLYRGLAGCADVLLAGAEACDRPAWRQTAQAVGEVGLVQFDRPRIPWPCGLPAIGSSPDLLSGLAGIGYFYLRLHQPQVVPTLLVLRDERDERRDERPQSRAAAEPLGLETFADLLSAPAALPEVP